MKLPQCLMLTKIKIKNTHTHRNLTRGQRTLVLCLTLANGGTNGNFLQTCFSVTYGLAPLQDIRFRNLSDLEFDLSRSLKVKYDDVIGLSLYAFLLMFNSNMWPNSAPLQDMRLRNLSDLEFDLSTSLKVKCEFLEEMVTRYDG